MSVRNSSSELGRRVQKIIEKAYSEGNISRDLLLSGNPRHHISAVRAELARMLVEEVGISLAECGRQIGATMSGIAQILMRKNTSI